MSNILYNGLLAGGGVVEGNFTEDLFLNVGDNTFETWPLAAGQVVSAGTVLGLDEATMQLVVCDKALGAVNGQLPYGVATHPHDTSATGLNAAHSIAVLTKSMGTLNGNVVAAVNYTYDELRAAFSKRGITLVKPYYSAL